jgi:hypothetical protein
MSHITSGKPPVWRRRWVQITGGIAAAFIALVAIGSATSHPNAAAPKAAPATSAPAQNPAPPPPPADPTPAGPAQFTAGDTEVISHGDTRIGTVTVGKPEVSTTPADQYGQNPAHGYYVVVKVTIATDKTYTDGLDVYSGNFYAKVGSGHFDEGDGNAYDALTSHQSSTSLSSNLGAGETTVGYLAFDVPSPHGQIAFAPNADDQPIAVWSY